jgi:catechol 1,2-dioxygenase
MIIRTLDDVTADALAAMSSTEDPRLRDILASLVKHLHAFVRDARLEIASAKTGIM